MKTKTISGIKVKANVKAGGLGNSNHTRAGLKVRVGVKAGEIVITTGVTQVADGEEVRVMP